MKNILKTFTDKPTINAQETAMKSNVVTVDDGITRTEKFYSYFIYSNKNNSILSNIYLTENQAYNLNELMKHQKSDISFVRS